MKIYDVLYSMNTGDATPKARPFDNLLGQALSGAEVEKTATGNPVSIVTNKAQNAISTILSYSPKQSGSGDPSPQNIRPIEGWTEANLFGCGKNLLNPSNFYSGVTVEDGVYTFSTAGYTANLYTGQNGSSHKIRQEDMNRLPYLKAGSYTFSCKPSSGGILNAVYIVDESTGERTVVGSAFSDGDYRGVKFTLTENARICICRSSNVYPTIFSEPQLEVGNSRTAYVPFITPTTITANLGGTYYGFSVDVERGVLRVDTEYVTLDGTENWTAQSDNARKFFRLNLSKEGYRSGIGICDQYTRVSIRTDNTDIGFNLSFSTDYYHFRFRPENISDTSIADWKTMLANQPVHAVIYKDTPIELPLTPQIVALLKGNNTLWTDGDSLSVTYKAKKA